ncbi:hypothetical protein D3C85_1831200 [compost metagenome]
MVSEEITQRRMPIAPKLCHGRREERLFKVLWHRIAHQSPEAYGHIGIAREIEIDECIEPDQ